MSHMPGLLLLVVYALAVARVTRFITQDRLFERPRDVIEEWAYHRAYPETRGNRPALLLAMQTQDTPLIAYLIGCPWCVSIYVGAFVAPIAWGIGESPIAAVPALALAFSYVTGLLASKEI